MKILLRNHPSNKWDTVESVEYSAEKDLQKLLAETPSLIAISDIKENVSPLVVGVRELGLPGSGNTDMLAFNAVGDIVVVECKLAANVEIKRKVIAQVLEYGAYLWGMTYDQLNDLVNKRTNRSLAELVGEAIGEPEWNEEEFRTNIQRNLTNGSFILVIAVDDMNDELARTIRFLNTCGNPSFAFTALEMHRYQQGSTEILVPHLYSATGQKPPVGTRKQWTEEQFKEALKIGLSPQVADLIKELYIWAKKKADRIWFGTGGETGSFTFHYLDNKKTVSVFSIYTSGFLILNYGWLSKEIEPDKMESFHKEITAIPSFKSIPADFKRWPSIKIDETLLNKSDDIDRFKQVVENFGKYFHK